MWHLDGLTNWSEGFAREPNAPPPYGTLEQLEAVMQNDELERILAEKYANENRVASSVEEYRYFSNKFMKVKYNHQAEERLKKPPQIQLQFSIIES